MESYEVFLSLSSMEFLKSIRLKERKLIGQFIERLSTDPFQEGDYSETDSAGRRIEIKVIGQYAVTYWTDSPVNEVKVVAICRADGGG